MQYVEIIEGENKDHVIVCPPNYENQVGKALFESKLPEWRSLKNADELGRIHFCFEEPTEIEEIKIILAEFLEMS